MRNVLLALPLQALNESYCALYKCQLMFPLCRAWLCQLFLFTASCPIWFMHLDEYTLNHCFTVEIKSKCKCQYASKGISVVWRATGSCLLRCFANCPTFVSQCQVGLLYTTELAANEILHHLCAGVRGHPKAYMVVCVNNQIYKSSIDIN